MIVKRTVYSNGVHETKKDTKGASQGAPIATIGLDHDTKHNVYV